MRKINLELNSGRHRDRIRNIKRYAKWNKL